MSFRVKQDDSFEHAEPIARECPHCGAHAQLIPLATPSFEGLMQARPRHAGIAFRCAACSEPRFARVAIRSFGPEEIVLSANLVEIERAKERYPFSYLPKAVSHPFREALDCYTADLFNAFAVMCRRSVQAALIDTRLSRNPNLIDLYKDVAQLSDIDRETSELLEAILFGSEAMEPEIDAQQAAVLVEITKDMLYQCYVRTAKLKAAMKMRRYFAGEITQKITPIAIVTRRANSV